MAHDPTLWALDLVRRLKAIGVQEAVVCPGSRSTPLALAADALLCVHVVLDEREAGFFALGLAKAQGLPVVVVTTSGTAVANLLPPVVEANEDAVPLVLLTADRPPRLRGTGANQTIDQVGLFGRQVRAEVDLLHGAGPDLLHGTDLDPVLAAAVGTPAGPVHINVPLDEPLEPSAAGRAALEAARSGRRPEEQRPWFLPHGPAEADVPRLEGPGVVVVGPRWRDDGLPEAVLRLAEALDAPVLADVLSGLRVQAHPRVVTSHDAFLPTAPHPAWVVRFGASPTSKALRTWLAGVPQFLVDEDGRGRNDIPGPVRLVRAPAVQVAQGWQDAPGERPDWSGAWRAAETAARAALDAVLAAHPEAEPAWVPRVLEAAGGDPVLVGNSLPVRDLERFGHIVAAQGNRGASGIDGLLSTAAGLAHGKGPVMAVVGDLSFQHGLGGLANVAQQDVRVVVVQNGGGRIFGQLPIAHAGLPQFERLFTTPQRFDAVRAAAAFGLEARPCTPSTLGRTLAEARVAVMACGNGHVVRQEATRRASLAARRAFEEHGWPTVA